MPKNEVIIKLLNQRIYGTVCNTNRTVGKKSFIATQKSGNKASIKKLEKILIELSKSPFIGTGQPEALKHELSGKWSRKINQKDRLIYKVDENIKTVSVISALGHYD